MSHLPLDARAILEYLNELGYRNISADQLKEFLKGMQPQSEFSKSKPKNQSTNTKQQQLPSTTQLHELQRTSVKVIKSKRPLCHFKFYLDIRDHQLAKKIEDQIKTLGGSLEFFLTPSVTHFITDKTVLPPTLGNNNNNTLSSRPGTPQTPNTPGTPQTPYSLESYDGKNHGSGTPSGSKKTRPSRADAILNRARRQSITTNVTAAHAELGATPFKPATTTSTIKADPTQPYKVWQTEYALRFFIKIQQDLKQYLDCSRDRKLHNKSYTVEPINLKGGFLKIESLKRNYRPYYQLFKKPTEWPKIELTRDDGAFRLSPKKALEGTENQQKPKMTRKSRSRSSQRQQPLPAAVQALKKGDAAAKSSTGQRNSNNGACKQPKETSEKQCGVCEICKIEYDTLTIHLKTKDHEYFAKNSQNFIALDTLIKDSANVDKFLDEEERIELKTELEEMEVDGNLAPEVDVDAPDPLGDPRLLSMQRESKRRSSSAYKTPSPTLREKSKRSTKGKHSSEKFQNTVKQVPNKPKTPTKSATPQKKPSSSMLEMQRTETAVSTSAAVATPIPRRKPSTAALISPPIRAMLPPSLLYKVVETPESCAQSRTARDAGELGVASPSLIVKFKKVRQTEVMRLNGEAENFMFPKQRSSSELPTDVDRQTTSDNARVSVSSTSLESTSDHLIDVEAETTELASQPHSNSSGTPVVGKKAIATAKRRKGGQLPNQNFPIAPIQPEVQLKISRRSSTTAAPEALTLAAIPANITLPEATRKSSRTATAIVTAATTSSRLLRAAVEAAKNINRHQAATATCLVKQEEPPVSPRKCSLTATKEVKAPEKPMKRRGRKSAVKLEDRMGDMENFKLEVETSNANYCVEADRDSDNELDDDDEDDDEDVDDDDDDDEDYMDYLTRTYRQRRKSVTTTSSQIKRISARKPRISRRHSEKPGRSAEDYSINDEKPLPAKPAGRKSKGKRSSTGATATKKTYQQFYDYTKSERLNKLRYAFERLPAADLWHRVFSRQDACEERYFEYFGSTKYRKLPYELGPIPFQHTLNGSCCVLCNTDTEKPKKMELANDARVKLETENAVAMKSAETPTLNGINLPTHPCATSSSLPYKHKHKKLHLLHRYRQEQQELLQKEQNEQKPPSTETTNTAMPKCDSKANTPDRERERAGSIHSTASSCASSAATSSKQKYRNKHLSKVAFLNLELPPRKSPREHASTLALVSCLIKQRQDSQSKPNSETDEPPATPTLEIKEETISAALGNVSACATNTAPAAELPVIGSPHIMRSPATTPVEEMRFATEISENVKRMRRGQNKYDHSPPIVPPPARPRGRPPKSVGRPRTQSKYRCQTSKEKRRKIKIAPITAGMHIKHNSLGGLASLGSLPSVRKTGSKKGVLEFEVDESALKALDIAIKYKNVRQLEWEIDKYLELSSKEYELNVDMDAMPASILLENDAEATATAAPTVQTRQANMLKVEKPATPAIDINTPPPTDCFSSDFDLCDLFKGAQPGSYSDDEQADGKRKGFNLYSSVALNNYFRKRKSLKSNRTGWPKVQKKKTSVRQQHILRQKIRFLQGIGEVSKSLIKNDSVNDESTKKQPRESAVITPPDSEFDDSEFPKEIANENDGVADTELDAAESIPEEDDLETVPDSVDDEQGVDADADADADADEEAEDDDDEEEEDDDDDDDEEEDATADEDVEEDDYPSASNKRSKRSGGGIGVGAVSPMEKLTNNCLRPSTLTVSTSATPSTHMLRGLRRTPQLNGSLGSCISPSEKAGDNSDIFTVSSDGLETDLDMSNSHTQLKADDEQQEHCPHHTPKRKFDLSKYAPKNSGAASCAAEAATAAVKSLAIAQFLNKEVRVTCRRLRAPFRRFRYRR